MRKMTKKKIKGCYVKFCLTKEQSDELNKLRKRLDMKEVDYTKQEVSVLLK